MNKILYNAFQTPDGTILHSKHVHDFITHLDKNGETYMNDGGTEYLRRSVNEEPYKDLTIYDDGKHETRRNWIYWGQNYDKDHNLLPETIFKPVKDLSLDHIEAILRTIPNLSKLYRDVFLDEISYRESLILNSYK